MFSFRQYKEDKHDLKVFENVVLRLDDSIRDFLYFINNKFELRPSSSMDLMLLLENIDSLVSIYMNNRYSSPAQVFNIDNEMDIAKQAVSNISGVSMYISEYFQSHSNGESDNVEDFPEFRDNVSRRLAYNLAKLNISLQAILFNIQRDVMCVMMGVDLRRELKDRRRIKMPRKRDIQYTITFTKTRSKNNKKECKSQ